MLVRSGDSVEGNLVVDSYNGNLYTSTIPSNATNQIHLLKSTDGGATWSESTAYTAPAGSDPAAASAREYAKNDGRAYAQNSWTSAFP